MDSLGRLKVIAGAQAGTAWDLTDQGSFPLGTNPKARFRIEGEGVEPVHAGIHCSREGVFVDNRARHSPVKVNGEVLAGRHRLQAGDLLLVGGVTLEYQEEQGDLAKPAARRRVPGPPPREDGDSLRPIQYSGRAPLQGVLMGLGTGAAGGLLLAIAYGYFTLFNPCVGWLTFLVTAAFGALTGLAAGLGMGWGKVRCRRTQGLVGIAVGLLALHMSWAVWVSAFFGSQHGISPHHATSVSSLFFHPGNLVSDALRICDRGAWTLFSSWSPSGMVLGLVWLMEAAIVVGAAYFGAQSVTPALFCEACGTWGEPRAAVHAIEALDPDAVKEHLAAGDLSFLAESPSPGSDAASWIQVDLAACKGCGDTRTLTLHTATQKPGQSKEAKVETTAIAEDLLVTRQEAEWIEALSPGTEAAGAVPTPKPVQFHWKK